MRIISLCPSNTEILHAIGVDPIAVDDYSDYPPDLDVPKLGPDLSIDLDKVEALEPDLVLASLSVPGMEKNVEGLEERGIPYTIVKNPEQLGEIPSIVREVGEMIGNVEEADAAAKEMERVLQLYREMGSEITPIDVYFEWWPKPIFTPGKTNWLTEMAELAGARNVFADVEEASVQTTWEEVLARNPQKIIAIWVGTKPAPLSVLEKREEIDGRDILILEEALFCRPSPRLFVGLKKLAYLLHPKTFPSPV
ncbi:ABC transporter substrate-binding protein [Paenalkalicoccus suaedae]|uniref:ABC transporter substrate-binding protein n=1 Tax=Paenalkalicoccus suaedae TaxID=2592382 RepID=A0A859FG93_9BACI|nr:helical backbone metal receptor [Paenalkalicoccus suaedae]QKS71246.1 ABC transporter substrate-binding protein [Paenalkalicoccus suaedae]